MVKKRSGCGTIILVILLIIMLMSCGRNDSNSSRNSNSNSTQDTGKSTTDTTSDTDYNVNRYISSLVGEWMYIQTSQNGQKEDEIHFIFNADQTGFLWMNDNQQQPIKYKVTDLNAESTKAFLVCEGETVNNYFLIDVSNSANGTIRNIEYEMWHPGDR